MKNKLNVVAVNCDAHPRLCSAEGIKVYPTLKMYVLCYGFDGRTSRLSLDDFGIGTMKERKRNITRAELSRVCRTSRKSTLHREYDAAGLRMASLTVRDVQWGNKTPRGR